ncbi:hypothetical protein [Bacillus sp. RO1]|uniref:hypothetical protein n=1 Tax=Bacillus sp. RO1 TaxID=2722703 RepID=UPI001456783C|nr:hypothetical protein [Bacillus sp. RO1]NLP52627.1 hypothetical protein [Bacillus sp. RO1]
MPMRLWFVIGFAILLVFGALVDHFGKKRRRSAHSASHSQSVDQVKPNQDTFFR